MKKADRKARFSASKSLFACLEIQMYVFFVEVNVELTGRQPSLHQVAERCAQEQQRGNSRYAHHADFL
jgi:hypothetical protein